MRLALTFCSVVKMPTLIIHANGDGGYQDDANENELPEHVHASGHEVHRTGHTDHDCVDGARHACAGGRGQEACEYEDEHVSRLTATRHPLSWRMKPQQEKS